MDLIVAKDRNNVIGKDGLLPWSLPGDLKWFKENTLGRPVIMGRKTHESIGKCLPGRLNVILTGDRQYKPLCDDAILLHSVSDTVRLFRDSGMVIGGGEIYRQLLPFISKMYVTEVDTAVLGDAYFPDTSVYQWRTTYEENKVENGLRYKLKIKERLI